MHSYIGGESFVTAFFSYFSLMDNSFHKTNYWKWWTMYAYDVFIYFVVNNGIIEDTYKKIMHAARGKKNES